MYSPKYTERNTGTPGATRAHDNQMMHVTRACNLSEADPGAGETVQRKQGWQREKSEAKSAVTRGKTKKR